MESLPVYIEGQLPQNPFEALITRVSAPLLESHPDARFVLESFIESQKAPTYNNSTSEKTQDSPKPIDRYPQPEGNNDVQDLTLLSVKQSLVDELFKAITKEDNESINLLIQHNLLSPNVTNRDATTPLLRAILTKNLGIVKQLLDLGADPDMFGEILVNTKSLEFETRTPLMLAARIGSLPIVKLLFEPPYSANDALIAPDGQIALRLAAEHDHRMIVDYLPARRGGAFLRWKARNAHNIARIKKAGRGIFYFAKFFVWDIPKFILWSMPKHGFVLPIIDTCRWSWENRKRFGNWCKRQAIEVPKKAWRGIKKIPKGIADVGKSIGRGLKKLGPILLDFVKGTINFIKGFIKAIPKVAAEVGRGLWKFFTTTLPHWLKTITQFIWEMLTERIPSALGFVARWTWGLLKSFALSIWDILISISSFLHTSLLAVITFLRNVKLRDVWNSFCDVLTSIFVTFPKKLWSWMRKFGEMSLNAMEALFGQLGIFFWAVGTNLFHLAVYIPRKTLVILASIADSMAKGAHEIRVWIDPKA